MAYSRREEHMAYALRFRNAVGCWRGWASVQTEMTPATFPLSLPPHGREGLHGGLNRLPLRASN